MADSDPKLPRVPRMPTRAPGGRLNLTFSEYDGLRKLHAEVVREHNAALARVCGHGTRTVRRFIAAVGVAKRQYDNAQRTLYGRTPANYKASDFQLLLDALTGWRAEVRYQEAVAHLAHAYADAHHADADTYADNGTTDSNEDGNPDA